MKFETSPRRIFLVQVAMGPIGYSGSGGCVFHGSWRFLGLTTWGVDSGHGDSKEWGRWWNGGYMEMMYFKIFLIYNNISCIFHWYKNNCHRKYDTTIVSIVFFGILSYCLVFWNNVWRYTISYYVIYYISCYLILTTSWIIRTTFCDTPVPSQQLVVHPLQLPIDMPTMITILSVHKTTFAIFMPKKNTVNTHKITKKNQESRPDRYR